MLLYSLRCAAVRYGLFAAGLSAACVLVGLTLWWEPAWREQARIQEQIDAIRATSSENMRTAQLVQAQREALQSVAGLERKLDAPASQADLIQDIARLAARRSVRVVAQSFEEGKAQRNDAPLYMDLGLQGSYPALRGLIGDLTTLPMWIEVVEARLDRSADDSASVRMQLRLVTYREPKAQS